MKRFLIFLTYYSYWIVSAIFVTLLLLVIFKDVFFTNEVVKSIIISIFWFFFGLFAGFYLLRIIIVYLRQETNHRNPAHWNIPDNESSQSRTSLN